MIKLKQTIIVEGRYDKARLANLFDAPILETGGFGIFKDREKLSLIRRLAASDGVILLTDSDMAGFKIRRYIAQGAGKDLPKEKILHVYIPDLYGKESRKTAPSAEGKLGVEGVPDQIILAAFAAAGITGEEPTAPRPQREITKQDFYEDGLTGAAHSAGRRRALCARLELPARLSANALIEVLNRLTTYEEYKTIVNQLDV